jgi:hypothetical protein
MQQLAARFKKIDDVHQWDRFMLWATPMNLSESGSVDLDPPTFFYLTADHAIIAVRHAEFAGHKPRYFIDERYLELFDLHHGVNDANHVDV